MRYEAGKEVKSCWVSECPNTRRADVVLTVRLMPMMHWGEFPWPPLVPTGCWRQRLLVDWVSQWMRWAVPWPTTGHRSFAQEVFAQVFCGHRSFAQCIIGLTKINKNKSIIKWIKRIILTLVLLGSAAPPSSPSSTTPPPSPRAWGGPPPPTTRGPSSAGRTRRSPAPVFPPRLVGANLYISK